MSAAAWFNFVRTQVPVTPTALSVGQPPLPFTLSDSPGRPVRLVDYRGKKPEVVAVSPDSSERSQRLAAGLGLGYRFLTDPDLAVARGYGLLRPGGGPGGQDVPRPDPEDVLRAVRAL